MRFPEREPRGWDPAGRAPSERAGPVQAMGALTDGLLRLFAHPAPWAKELRNRGLGLVEAAAPLKRWLVSQALGR